MKSASGASVGRARNRRQRRVTSASSASAAAQSSSPSRRRAGCACRSPAEARACAISVADVVEAGGRRDRTQRAEFERARRLVEAVARAADQGQRIGEQRGERPGREVACQRQCEPRQHAGFGFAERAAGRSLDLDAPARQFGGDAPGDGDIGRDQRGGAAGRLQRFAHRDGERQRLLVLVVGDDDRDVGEAGDGVVSLNAPAPTPRSYRRGATRRR